MTSRQSEEVELRRRSGSSSARSPRNENPQQWHSLPAHAELLTTFDVFSLIANKMIGSGIYNNASTVLVLTGDKGLAMTLWVLGFVYTLISMVIYLECSAVMPYTGGELVYIDELTSRSNGEASQHTSRLELWLRRKTGRYMNKLFGDGLFAYVQYAFLFIAFFNSATNSLQVGRQLLVAIRPQDAEPDHNVLRLIAVNALSIICLIQYFDPQSARKLNRWLASIKILFLLMVFFAGCSAVRKGLYSGAGFQECHPSDLPRHKVLAAKAMMLVIFSYEGWENATFVAGEINPAKQSTLRKGFIWAVFVVGFLYIGVIAVFLKAIPYAPVTINFVPMFYGNNQAAYQAWAILIAISSLGSLNSIIYTFSRIKQSIGFGNVLPWSSFWKKDSPTLFGSENLDQDRAPKGGLVLHWIMSVTLIGTSASINSTLESINLSALLRTYSHCIILVVIGVAVLRLPSRARDLYAGSQAHAHTQERLNEENPSWDWDFRLRNCKGGWRAIPAGFAIIYAAFNFTVVIVTAIPPYSGQDGDLPSNWSHSNGNKTLTCNNDNPDLRTSLTFPIPVDLSNGHAPTGWVVPVAAFGVVIFATAYYLLVFGSVQKFRGWSLARWAGVKPTIDRDQVYDFGEERVRRFGSRREISFIPSRQESKVGFLYWVFGGSALFTSSDDRPLTRWRKYKNDKIEAVAEPCQSAWVWLWKRRRG